MEYRQYLKSIADDSVIVRDEIISVNTKNVETLKMERNDFKKFVLKIVDEISRCFYENLIFGKPLHIMLDKVDEFIRDFDETRYLILFGTDKYDAISDRNRFDRNRHLIGLKSSITYADFLNYAKVKTDSDDNLHLEETLIYA